MKPQIKVIIAMLIYGSLGVFVTALDLPSAIIVFVRAALGFLVLFAVSLFRGRRTDRALLRKTFPMLLLIGAMIGINWLLLFSAYRYSVSVATLCYYFAPVITILLCVIFLREKLTASGIIGIIIVLLGMVFVNGRLTGGSGMLYCMLFGLGAAVLYGCIIFLNKAVKGIGQCDGLELTLVQMLGAAIVMGIYMIFTYKGELRGIDAKSIVILVILGVVHTGLAYYLYFSSIKELPGQTLAVLSYADPVSALFFSAVFLNEKLSLLQWIGAVLVIGGAFIAEFFKGRRAKQ